MNTYDKKSGMKRQGMLADGFIRTDTEIGMRQAVRDSPDDDTPLLVYADLLAEQSRFHAEARVRWWAKARRRLRSLDLDGGDKAVEVREWVMDSEQRRSTGAELNDLDDPLQIIDNELADVKPEWVKRLFVIEMVRRLSWVYDPERYKSALPTRRIITIRSPQFLASLVRSAITIMNRLPDVIKLSPEQRKQFQDCISSDRLPPRDIVHELVDAVFSQTFAHSAGLIKDTLTTAEEFALHLAGIDELTRARVTLTPFTSEYGWGYERDAVIPTCVNAAVRCANKSLYGTVAMGVLEDLFDDVSRRHPIITQVVTRVECGVSMLLSVREMTLIIKEESPTKRLG